MKNILITGISGFIGTNLVQYFSSNENFKLFGLDIISNPIEGVEKTYSWENLSAIKDMDAVIHLAGKAHDLKNSSDEQAYIDVNYGLTKKIFDWYNQSTASKFFMMSSVKAVADVVEGELTELAKPNPVTAYGKSKVMAEDYLNSIEISSQKSLYIFRPAMVHGPGNKGNLNLLYKIVSKGIPWPLASFENSRSFVSVGNLCFAFKYFIENSVTNGTYNIADDEAISTNKLISIISKAIGIRPRLLKIPKSLIIWGAKIGTILHLPLNTVRLQKLTENYVVSNKKISKVLGGPFSILAEDGLMKTIKSFNK